MTETTTPPGEEPRSDGVRPYRIMVVCTANVCRSPMGAEILRETIADRGWSDHMVVESSGTGYEAEGFPIDDRAAAALLRHAYGVPDHTARAIRVSELPEWDLLLAMTHAQAEDLRRKARGDAELERRVFLWREFDPGAPVEDCETYEFDMTDPFYGGKKAFDRTLTAMERAIPSILHYAECHYRRTLRAMQSAS